MTPRRMHLSIIAASFALFGFHQENGCGGEPPAECELLLCAQNCTNGTKLDDDGCPTCECNPPPACEGLDEQACLSDPACEPIYSDVLCDAAPCAPDDEACFRAPCQAQYEGCREKGPCEGLDEQACIADPACAPQYEPGVCTLECRPDPSDPNGCLPCDPVQLYAGCSERTGCEALDEYSCSSDPSCEPIYGDVACDASAPCAPDDASCFVPPPCESEYLGCRERNGCEGRDEYTCASDPQCEPIYGDVVCGATEPCSPDDAECFRAPPPCESEYLGCRERSGCEALDETSCIADPACEPHYLEAACTLECKEDPNDPTRCLPCEPLQIYAGCHPAGECGTR